MNQDQTGTKIALIEKDINQITILCSKLEQAIKSIHLLNSDISAILKLHESKIELFDKQYDKITSTIESRRVENLEHVEALHLRINQYVESNLEMHAKIEKGVEKKVEDRLGKVEECVREESGKLSRRIIKIEKWQYMVIGGGFIILGLFSLLFTNWQKFIGVFGS